MNWKVIEEWILARLTETSTWVGIFTLVASITGSVIAPEHTTMIMTAGTGLASTILVAMKQKGSDK